jgi:tRNA U34 2-thiouridine synthase MnmA/TrmU
MGFSRDSRAALTTCNAAYMPQDKRGMFILRRHDVFGVFMRNWDESEEKGNYNCTVEADFTQAQSVCQHLGVPLHEVNFVRQYWTQVFTDFIAQVSSYSI